MISAIVYGRNDNHGYGMVKRVAIGLNALATQIDSSSGEILFVDYNTPDHLPTLPELIWDTFTPQTLKLLRVLRVRPAQHARVARMTPLPVVEAIARNVALRRSNPRNRWVLSTNTDALVAPRNARRLSEVVEKLPDGIFGLPRYELPERAWEGFSRTSPDECLALATEWADQARLREVVYATDDVLYDHPGDFQLMPRFELISIGGFEEGMLLHSHVDRNIARRVSLRLGPVRSLSDHFDLYHLGHSRIGGSTDARKLAENDTFRFVIALESPFAMHAADEWGMAREDVEELKLDIIPGEQVRSVCRAIMAPLGSAVPEVRYQADTFDHTDYDVGRVAAHILDLVSSYPETTAFAYSGVRLDLFELLRKGLAALGFQKKILVPRRLADHLATCGLNDVQVGEDETVLATADILLFEFGRIGEQNIGGASELSQTAAIDIIGALLGDAVQIERRLPFYHPRRLFVTVGATHTRFENLVNECIEAGTSPFTTRLRYGEVIMLPGHRARSRRLDEHPEDAAHALDLVKLLAKEEALTPAQRFDVVAHADLITGLLDGPLHGSLKHNERAHLQDKIAHALQPALELAEWKCPLAPEEPALSGPARSDAWNDCKWASVARFFSPNRNGWVWERAQILQGVTATLRHSGEKPVLLVCEQRDRLIDAFAARLGSVDVMDVRELLGEPLSLSAASLSADATTLGTISFKRLTDMQPGGYGVIVLPHASAFRGGVVKLGALLGGVQPLLAEGGSLVIGGEVSILGIRDAMRPSIAAAESDGFPALVDRLLGLRLIGNAQYGLRPIDRALVGTREQRDNGMPVLAIAEQNDILWPHVWFFTKSRNRPIATSAAELDNAFLDLLLGEQIHKLSLGAGAVRIGTKIGSGPIPMAGHAVFGPYAMLKKGRYHAQFDFEKIAALPQAPKDTRLVVEIGIKDTIVNQKIISLGDIVKIMKRSGRSMVSLDTELANDTEHVEMRVWSNGAINFTLTSALIFRS